jgi:hypothetical protein
MRSGPHFEVRVPERLVTQRPLAHEKQRDDVLIGAEASKGLAHSGAHVVLEHRVAASEAVVVQREAQMCDGSGEHVGTARSGRNELEIV